MKTKLLLLLSSISLLSTATGQDYNVNRIELHRKMTYDNVRHIIKLPTVNGMKPLTCDFHIHTVFSDGDVWPTARVREAWNEGLDVIAITDHTSAKPSKKNVVGGPNSSYEIAKPEAESLGIMLIQGTEISRSKTEGGHLNAIFITDATKTLDIPTKDAVREAVRQGAYVIWNHPGWDIDSCKMFDVNEQLISEGSIHAVEVFNEAEWYPRALSWTKDHKIAAISTSDIHNIAKNQYRLTLGTMRPMTIVMAKENTPEALKEALFARQTIAYGYGMLAGEEGLLTDFFQSSISVRQVFADKNAARYEISNQYDIAYELILENGSELMLPANSRVMFETQPQNREIKANVRNIHTYEYRTLDVVIKLSSEKKLF